jgi:hypothetical protein
LAVRGGANATDHNRSQPGQEVVGNTKRHCRRVMLVCSCTNTRWGVGVTQRTVREGSAEQGTPENTHHAPTFPLHTCRIQRPRPHTTLPSSCVSCTFESSLFPLSWLTWDTLSFVDVWFIAYNKNPDNNNTPSALASVGRRGGTEPRSQARAAQRRRRRPQPPQRQAVGPRHSRRTGETGSPACPGRTQSTRPPTRWRCRCNRRRRPPSVPPPPRTCTAGGGGPEACSGLRWVWMPQGDGALRPGRPPTTRSQGRREGRGPRDPSSLMMVADLAVARPLAQAKRPTRVSLRRSPQGPGLAHPRLVGCPGCSSVWWPCTGRGGGPATTRRCTRRLAVWPPVTIFSSEAKEKEKHSDAMWS